MTATDPALAQLARSLESLAWSGEPSQLRDYLSGRRLPAIGGDLDPAEVILRAISLQPAEVRKGLARLLAPLISEEAERLRLSEEAGSERPSVLLSALYLAAELPADAVLFAVLKNLKEHPPAEGEDFWISVWQALVYQQTDDSLEPSWFQLIQSGSIGLAFVRTLLLTAWRGLLWIPPSAEEWLDGEIINFPRLSHGLKEVYLGVSGNGEEGLALLQTCLDILAETYPRSGEFWANIFLPYPRNWPKGLSEIVARRWSPQLANVRKAG